MIDVSNLGFFKRDGNDLYCEVPVSFPQAALGAEIEVPTIDGSEKLKIPSGTPSGRLFHLKGKGIHGTDFMLNFTRGIPNNMVFIFAAMRNNH